MTDSRESNEAARHYAAAVAALNRRDWDSAWRIAQGLLHTFGEHPGVHFVAGVGALEQRQLAPAVAHLRRAVAMNGTRADYLTWLAKAFAQAGDFRSAGEAADRAVALQPDDALLLDTLGVVYTEAGRHVEAAQAFAEVVRRAPGRANSRFNLATALLYAGRIDEAESEYEACLSVDARYWKAYTALSQLRRQRPERNHLDRFGQVLARHRGEPQAETYLHLALAKEHEDLGDYDTAFAHYRQGKAAGRRGQAYSRDATEAQFAALAAAFTPADAAGAPTGDPNGEPIFVVGMPRSGTTLLDRILGSHPQVTSAGELHQMPVAVKRASGSTTPHPLDLDTLARTDRIDWAALGRAYIAATRPVTGQRPRFVDKLPHNFLYIGHILRALPNASVIVMRRHPLDSCLSNFRQLFSAASPFTAYAFDLMDTGHYYVQFDRLMSHWRTVFPGRVLELRYEDLVLEQEATTRRLLAHCGLAWDARCLHFEHNDTPTATASLVQVREPMQRRYLDRWKHYEPHLGALRDYLRSAGVAVP